MLKPLANHRRLSRRLRACSLLLVGLVYIGLYAGQLNGDTATPSSRELSPRELHVWGRFGVGAWKQVRVVTENLNDRGQVIDTTVTETKTTLVRADARQLTLKIEASVEVAGKRFQSPAQYIDYGYYGESPSGHSESKNVGSEGLTIDGEQVSCQIRQVVATVGQQQQITKLYLSDDVEPFVLKRDTTVMRNGAASPGEPQTTTEVIAVDVPYKVLHDVKSAAYEKTTQKSSRGTNTSLDIVCVDVPGGVVARTSKEFDSQGHLVRRSTLSLVDYRAVDDDDDDTAQMLTRRQARKARRR